jgi:hypothetical protein
MNLSGHDTPIQKVAAENAEGQKFAAFTAYLIGKAGLICLIANAFLDVL